MIDLSVILGVIVLKCYTCMAMGYYKLYIVSTDLYCVKCAFSPGFF